MYSLGLFFFLLLILTMYIADTLKGEAVGICPARTSYEDTKPPTTVHLDISTAKTL